MADPLSVTCPTYAARAGYRCHAYSVKTRTILRWLEKPHAARLRAAEAKEKKEGERG